MSAAAARGAQFQQAPRQGKNFQNAGRRYIKYDERLAADPNLKDMDVKVFGFVLRLASLDPDGRARPSIKTIGENPCIKRKARTVQNSLRRLERFDYLIRDPRFDKKSGRQTSNYYTINDQHPLFRVIPMPERTTGSGLFDSPQPDENTAKNCTPPVQNVASPFHDLDKSETPPPSSSENTKNTERFDASEHLRAREGAEPESQTPDFADWNEQGRTQNAEPIKVKNPESVPRVLGDSPEAKILRLFLKTTNKTPDAKMWEHMTESAMKRPGGTLLGFYEYAAERTPNLKTCPRPKPGVFWTLAENYSRDVVTEFEARERKVAQDKQLLDEKQPPKVSIQVTPGCGCKRGLRVADGKVIECQCEAAREYRRGLADVPACGCVQGKRETRDVHGKVSSFDCQCEAAKEYRRGLAEQNAAAEAAPAEAEP